MDNIGVVVLWVHEGSELRVPTKKQYDPCKTMLAGDVKTKAVKTGKGGGQHNTTDPEGPQNIQVSPCAGSRDA